MKVEAAAARRERACQALARVWGSAFDVRLSDDPGLAHHEAGHAVVGETLGAPTLVVAVCRFATPGFGNLTRLDWWPGWVPDGGDDRPEITLAGPIAEGQFQGVDPHDFPYGCAAHAAKDYIEAADVAAANLGVEIPGDPWKSLDCLAFLQGEGRAVAADWAAEAHAILADRWDVVERIAAELIDRQVLDGERVAELVRR